MIILVVDNISASGTVMPGLVIALYDSRAATMQHPSLASAERLSSMSRVLPCEVTDADLSRPCPKDHRWAMMRRNLRPVQSPVSQSVTSRFPWSVSQLCMFALRRIARSTHAHSSLHPQGLLQLACRAFCEASSPVNIFDRYV